MTQKSNASNSWFGRIKQQFGNLTSKTGNRKRSRKSGQNRLHFESLEKRDLLATMTLNPGQVAFAGIGTISEVDKFRFTVAANDVIELQLANRSPNNPGFVPRGRLFRPNGTEILDFTSNSGRQRLTLPNPGTYELRVRDNNLSQTGNYSVGYERLKPASLDAVNIQRGAVKFGGIGHQIEKDQYVFHANANDVFDLIVKNSQSTPAGFVATAELISPSGVPLQTINTHSGARRFTAPATGTYIVQVADDDQKQNGNYSLGLEGIRTISTDRVTLQNGHVSYGGIGTPIERDQFVFSAQAGEIFELAIRNNGNPNGFVATASLFAPNGAAPISTFNTSSNTYRFTAATTGTYMVMVGDDNWNEAGNYAIGLERIKAASQDAVALQKGQVSYGGIGNKTEKDQWVFTGATGQIVDLAITQSNTNVFFKATVNVFSPAGQVIRTFNASHGNQRITLPAAGSYVVQVQDDNMVDGGNYALGFYGITPMSPNALNLERGVWRSRGFGHAVQKHQYAFSAAVGQTITLNATHSSTSPFFDPLIEVFSANGRLLTSFRASQGSKTLTLNFSGPFLIQVADYGFDATGNYSLRWV